MSLLIIYSKISNICNYNEVSLFRMFVKNLQIAVFRQILRQILKHDRKQV